MPEVTGDMLALGNVAKIEKKRQINQKEVAAKRSNIILLSTPFFRK